MRRNSLCGVLTLLACVALAGGAGCDTKSTSSGGSTSKSANANAGATKTSDTNNATAHTDASNPSHGSATPPSNQPTATDARMNGSTPMVMGELVALDAIGLKRLPSGAKPSNERDATADLIYATVRVKMDIMIAERKELLDAGLATTDPEVRSREASINRAISLLTENGEKVDPIEPPITQ